MSKVSIGPAGSVDGYITGRDPGAGRGFGVATEALAAGLVDAEVVR
jgi:hypothetical protein